VEGTATLNNSHGLFHVSINVMQTPKCVYDVTECMLDEIWDNIAL
jgi:hypothetical protein